MTGRLELPDGGHAVHTGDRLAWPHAMATADGPRVENGVCGEAIAIDERDGSLTKGAARRQRPRGGSRPGRGRCLRLGYAGHVYRQQGATVERALVVTGGWETSRESAYVEELEGADDAERVDQLAARMSVESLQLPSIAHALLADPDRVEPDIARTAAPQPEPPSVEIGQ